jgi:type II secretory pathway component PulF
MGRIGLRGILFSLGKRRGFDAPSRRRFYSDLSSILRTESSTAPVQIRAAIEEFRKIPGAPVSALKEIVMGMERGLDFSEAIKPLAPESETLILSAAEATGDPAALVRLLKILASNMEETQKIRKKFIGAVKYPGFLLLNSIGMIVYFSDSIVPRILSGFHASPEKLQGVGIAAYEIFTIVRNVWPLLFAGPAGLVVLIWISLRYDFPGRRFLDRLPPWSIYRMMTGTDFMTGLSAMLESGIPIMSAFDQIRRQASPYLRARISPIMRIYRKTGKLGLAMSMAGDFPSPSVIVRLSIREKYGDLAQALAEFSKDWKEEGLPKIEEQSQNLEYAAMGLAGGVLAFMVLGIFIIVKQSVSGGSFGGLGAGLGGVSP